MRRPPAFSTHQREAKFSSSITPASIRKPRPSRMVSSASAAVTPRLRHAAATCTVGELRAHTCSTCGESQTEATSARLDHQWADWSVLVPSTCEEEGTLTMPCTQ